MQFQSAGLSNFSKHLQTNLYNNSRQFKAPVCLTSQNTIKHAITTTERNFKEWFVKLLEATSSKLLKQLKATSKRRFVNFLKTPNEPLQQLTAIQSDGLSNFSTHGQAHDYNNCAQFQSTGLVPRCCARCHHPGLSMHALATIHKIKRTNAPLHPCVGLTHYWTKPVPNST